MNDWIVANITNPNFTVSDFQNLANMSLTNTLMLKKEDYLKSDFIKNNDLFKDKNGEFSENLFDRFYNQAISSYSEFQQKLIPQTMDLDIFDTDRTATSTLKNPNFKIFNNPNPLRQLVGIEGVNIWSDPNKSISEIAQSSKIWNNAELKYEDFTPNDKSLTTNPLEFVKSIFEEPLILAQWEEDGEHVDPITKRHVKHVKGDYKLNEEGTYFYETLNGRSPIGKLVLSTLDVLTTDGEGLNKYDFFDSDDILKSTEGIIAKNIVSVLPLFLGGPIGTAYSTALIAREMAKSLPMLAGFTSLIVGDLGESPWLNTIAAMGEKFTGGTSDYAKQHVFSIENFGNLISDVALLWGLQKTIAKAVDKLRGSKNYVDNALKNAHALYNVKKQTLGALAAMEDADWMNSALGLACLRMFLPQAEKAAKQAGELGRDISLLYMAIISNSDVYGDALQYGATKREAAAVALGSTLGMFAVDKYASLGTVFFDDATEESVKKARASIKNEVFGYTNAQGVEYKGAREALQAIHNSSKTPANKVLAFINEGINAGKRSLAKYSEDLKYHTTNFWEKSMTEGLEEVSEELVTDCAKSIYELAGLLGFDTSVNDIGAWDNMLERYTMSMLGGAIGGGIFYGKEVWDGKTFKRDRSNEEMATQIRNGHANDLRDEVRRKESKGLLGSTKLSATQYQVIEGEDGPQLVWLSAKDSKDSLNHFIAKMVLDKIDALEAVINNNLMNLSDELLFQQMVLSENRYMQYEKIAPFTNYYLDYNNILMDLAAAELDYKAASNTIEGQVKGTPIKRDSDLNLEQESSRSENIEKLHQKVIELLNKRNEFLSGDSSLDYTRKLGFAMDRKLHSPFLAINRGELWKKEFGNKTYEEVSDEDKLKFEYVTVNLAYREALLKSLASKNALTNAWERFKQIEHTLVPELTNVALYFPQFKDWSAKFLEVLSSGVLSDEAFSKKIVSMETKLAGESDEDYEFRNQKRTVDGELETDEAFLQRRNNRVLLINKLNDEVLQEWVDKLLTELQKVNYMVDPLVKHDIYAMLPTRMKNIITSNILSVFQNDPLSIRNILIQLKPDLSNMDEIRSLIDKTVRFKEWLNLIKTILNFSDSINIEDDGQKSSIFTVIDDFILYNEPTTLKQVNDSLLLTDFKSLNFDEETERRIKIFFSTISRILGEDTLYEEFLQLTAISDINAFENLEQNYPTIANSFDAYYKDEIGNMLDNELNTFFNYLVNHPIILLKNKLDVSLKNPVLELVKSLANKTLDNREVKDIIKILDTLESKYENIDDIGDLVLDGAQMEALLHTKDLLQLVDTYIYAAAAETTPNRPLAHNKAINEFARNHSDLIEKWEELPEIEADYALIYQNQMAVLGNEIDSWINFSNNNLINKKNQFLKVDKLFSENLWKVIENQLNTQNFVVNIDDKSYDLLLGVDTVEIVKDLPNLNSYNVRRVLYKNFQEALNDTQLTISQFLEKSLLFKLLGINPDKVIEQDTSNFEKNVEKSSLTDYDKSLYWAMVLTKDPSENIRRILELVKKNSSIAPIIVLQYDAELAIASTTQLFKDIIQFIFRQSDNRKYACVNTTIIPGGAGVGKTSVCASSLKSEYEADDILVGGPTETQAKGLEDALLLKNSTTFNNLFDSILEQEVLNKIKTHIQTIDNNNFESEYFDATYNKGFFGISLKENAPIKFKEDAPKPKLIILDEATWLESGLILILDKYVSTYGGHVVLLGDSHQQGIISPSGLGNMREVDLLAVRTPRLTISLRDNNIHNYTNIENTRNLLDEVLHNTYELSKKELPAYWPKVQQLASKLAFKYYLGEELHGDMITPSLTNDLIKTIKKAISLKKSIGYIGDKSSSSYKALQDAGIAESIPDFNLKTMQGREFDLVIVDENMALDSSKPMAYRDFLLKLYTLMTRGKDGAIFIDNNLSPIIGPSIALSYTAKAPSITDKINGTSAVDELRELKQKELEAYNVEPVKINNTPQTGNMGIFVDPDAETKNAPEKALIKNLINTDLDQSETAKVNTDDFEILSWSEVTLMGVKEIQELDDSGKDKPYKTWKIEKPKEGPLRNLEIFMSDGSSAYSYRDKLKWESKLADIKSAILYNHTWDETIGIMDRLMPSSITTNFNKEDWNNGKLYLEIRSVNDEVLPASKHFKNKGIEYNGKRYWVNIVFKAKNKSGVDCIIDLAGINDPALLKEKIPEIESNINKVLSKTDNAELIKKLNNIKGSLKESSEEYASLFDKWINDFETNKKFELDITKCARRTETTWFDHLTKPLILGGDIDPSIEDLYDPNQLARRSLEALYPNIVFSPVYTYANKANINMHIDPSVRGHAVVFCTSDTLIPADQLYDVYTRLKLNPSSSPKVRMILLNNFGMSFSQLCSHKFIALFLNGKEERKPFRQNFTGTLMFTAMWNFRAALKNFTEALGLWKIDNNYNDQKVTDITHAAQDIYDKELGETEACKKYNITVEDLKALENFNTNILNNVPIFRLAFNKDGHGFHIQSQQVTNSTAYENGNVNFAYITPAKADLFQTFIKDIMRVFEPSSDNYTNTLGLQLYKKNTKGEKETFKKTDYIDLNDVKLRRTLSNMMHYNRDTGLTIEDGQGNYVLYREGDEWSAIPRVLSVIYRTVLWHLYNPTDTSDDLVYAKIWLHNLDNTQVLNKLESGKKEEYKMLEFFIGNWIKGSHPIIKTLDNTDTRTYNADKKLKSPDNSLSDFFNLMFHGTIENVHDKKPIRQTDARFKYGFYINPDVDHDAIERSALNNTNNDTIFYKITTNKSLFTSDVTPVGASIGLPLLKVKEIYKDSIEKKQPTKPKAKDNSSLNTKTYNINDLDFNNFNFDKNFYMVIPTDNAEDFLQNKIYDLSGKVIHNLDDLFEYTINAIETPQNAFIIVELEKEASEKSKIKKSDIGDVLNNLNCKFIAITDLQNSNNKYSLNLEAYNKINTYNKTHLENKLPYDKQSFTEVFETYKKDFIAPKLKGDISEEQLDNSEELLWNNNNSFITLKQYLLNLFKSVYTGNSELKIYIEDKNIIIEADNEKYILDKNSLTFVKEKNDNSEDIGNLIVKYKEPLTDANIISSTKQTSIILIAGRLAEMKVNQFISFFQANVRDNIAQHIEDDCRAYSEKEYKNLQSIFKNIATTKDPGTRKEYMQNLSDYYTNSYTALTLLCGELDKKMSNC